MSADWDTGAQEHHYTASYDPKRKSMHISTQARRGVVNMRIRECFPDGTFGQWMTIEGIVPDMARNVGKSLVDCADQADAQMPSP